MAITLIKPRLMTWAGNAISDHNRSSLSIDVNRIEKSQRMANGTLRKYVIADKRQFSCSWQNLPKLTSQTVDGFWGGEDIENFYNTNPGSFALTITDGDDVVSTYTVMITSFSREILKRGSVDLWSVKVQMDEV